MKILILGASGMLGNAIFRYLNSKSNFEVFGTVRNKFFLNYFPNAFKERLLEYNIDNFENILNHIIRIKPDVIINCIGLVKQVKESSDTIRSIKINSLFPHQLADYSREFSFKLIHFSTDCVFSGMKGNYKEDDIPDPIDLYGKSKLLGEVTKSNCITLRTSIIGHEILGSKSLINWFLSQTGSIEGYKKAFFSGLPTIEIAQILDEFILPNSHLNGLYHLGGLPINKLDLLTLVSNVYGKEIKITENSKVQINRVLNCNKFYQDFNYQPKTWMELIKMMHKFYINE